MNNLGNPELITQQLELSKQCDRLIIMMGKAGEELAQAQYDYNVQKAQTAFKLKDRGESATMIMQVLKGTPAVAERMLQRDLAKSKYDAIRENINIIKLQMRMNDSQISREWGSNE